MNERSGNTGIIFVRRIVRAIKLDASLYEEVEIDKKALPQAILIVILSSIAAGIGSIHVSTSPMILANILSALTGWLLWAYITLIIGTKLMPEPQTYADYGQMIRTIGFASAPGLLRVFGAVPLIGMFIFIAAQLWMLIAMVIAVKHALDYTNQIRPVIVSLFGWIVQIAIISIVLYFTN
jgi:hypothetical protein